MDGQLVERARAGDADAFDQLVRENLDSVYRLALGILGESADARDATQEAFVTAWHKLPTLRDTDQVRCLADQITVNACRMALRKKKTRSRAPTDAGGRLPSGRPICRPARRRRKQ